MEKIFHNQKGQVVGKFVDGIYRKKVVRDRHLMKMFNSYGLDDSIVEELNRLDCKELRILETDTKMIWHVDFRTFRDNIIRRSFDGMQCFIPGKYWEKDDPKQQKLLL